MPTVDGGKLTTGQTASCGCLKAEARLKHGGYKEPVYKVWHAMIERCSNAQHPSYKDYGGRGIMVCDRWTDFAAFRDDMGMRPPGGMLERKDTNGNYEPTNCRWATALEQANNRRNNRLVTLDGVTQTVAQWAAAMGLNRQTLLHRLNSGWDVQRAINMASNRERK
jgi:hypothetical protein